MPNIHKLYHQGIEILYADFRNCRSEDEMFAILKEGQALVLAEQKEYLQLSDFRGAYLTSSFMQKAKQVVRETPHLAKKRAMVGVNSPAKKILLHAHNFLLGKEKAVKAFEDIEEAKDWLASE